MVGVSFRRTTVVKDREELEKVMEEHSLQNGYEIRRKIEKLISNNNSTLGIKENKREQIR